MEGDLCVEGWLSTDWSGLGWPTTGDNERETHSGRITIVAGLDCH